MLLPVIGHILAAGVSHTNTVVLNNTEMLWVGVLIGSLVALLASTTMAWVLVVVSVTALGGLRLVGNHIGAQMAPWLLVAGAAILVGVGIGRKRGLRHLGESEFRGRLGAIKRVSRF